MISSTPLVVAPVVEDVFSAHVAVLMNDLEAVRPGGRGPRGRSRSKLRLAMLLILLFGELPVSQLDKPVSEDGHQVTPVCSAVSSCRFEPSLQGGSEVLGSLEALLYLFENGLVVEASLG